MGKTYNAVPFWVSWPSSVTYLTQTPIFEWCVVKFTSKNGHKKSKCLKEIELRAQHLLIIVGQ